MEADRTEGPKKPKRQMKTPFQLDALERTYSTEMYPSEATRAELSEKLCLTDRQLQMWFCHRRLKDKKDKETAGVADMKLPNPRKGLIESSKEELMAADPVSGHGSGPASTSDSDSSEFENEDDTLMVQTGYYESPRKIMEHRVVACVEAQLGESLREDGPMLGIEFDELPPGAFGSPIVILREHVRMDMYSQPSRQIQSPSPRSTDFVTPNDSILAVERKRKGDEVRTGQDVQANEKKIRKEFENQDILRRKRKGQTRKEMERQDRERQKEEQRLMREQQRQEEKNQREEKREMERREKFMQKELLRAEKMKHKEDRRRERDAARQRAAMERATSRKIAKESMDLIEDERLELMELAASSKGLPSILSLDYDTLQNLESFRDALCEFPPKSVQLRMPFSIQPWIESEENVGKLMMVWKFCATFADVLGLWPFTIDEFVQAFHDYDSRLLGEVHIAILKLIIKDIEDVVRTPSGGPGTNQYTAVNPEGGHPHIIEGAYEWGFDVRNWQKLLNPLTWPEIFRQFALSAGFGPQLKKKGIDLVLSNNNNESKGCEEIVSTLRNGSAAVNAVAIMQEKGSTRKSRHRLTPGTVKFAAYHVLALEGSKGLNVIELAEKIQRSGLRDLKTSKTPEASISVALSRDQILFERIAPSTYCVRPAFRKDPADADTVIASAKEKIQRCANGFLADQNADEEERDDESGSDVAESTEVVDALAIPMVDANKNGECNGFDIGEGYSNQGVEIDESMTGEPWIQGLTEGEYSDLPVEERLNALVALIGVANEGNSIRVILEERMDAANCLKKQMWAEAQLDKRRMREEIITKLYDSSFNATGECDLSSVVVKNESCVVEEDFNNSIPQAQQNEHSIERSRLQLKSYIGHRAEDLYVYRSLPLGQDRRRNRYWQFVATASCLDPGSGRIFVESSNGYWRLIDTEEAFDALLTSLDIRGTQESHLHIMLQKIEVCFKECVQRNKSFPNILDQNPSGAVCSVNSNTLDPSSSFRIEVGRNEAERNSLLKRYEDLQNWIWKECFNSSTVRAIAYGKNRCSPVLGICEFCLATYDSTGVCASCNRTHGKPSSPLRIRLIKAILSSLEVSVPCEGLNSSWTEDIRRTWGFELDKSSSPEGLLQFVTKVEGALKRDYISEDFETTEELLIRGEPNYLGAATVAPLPWIPMTTAAVALRLFELDASIFYTWNQKAESLDQKKVEVLRVSRSRKQSNNSTKNRDNKQDIRSRGQLGKGKRKKNGGAGETLQKCINSKVPLSMEGGDSDDDCGGNLGSYEDWGVVSDRGNEMEMSEEEEYEDNGYGDDYDMESNRDEDSDEYSD